jgi:hypothetical protein
MPTEPYDWGRSPAAARGDDSNLTTFTGVGRLMTCWESLEFELSRTYSIFCGDPDGPSLAEYGVGRIYRDRRTILSERAQRYFIQAPNQSLEGSLCALLRETDTLADRRNEVAHGIVMAVSSISHFREALNLDSDAAPIFLLIPPLYLIRRHDQIGRPEYSYSSAELAALGQKIIQVCDTARSYRTTLIAASHGRT